MEDDLRDLIPLSELTELDLSFLDSAPELDSDVFSDAAHEPLSAEVYSPVSTVESVTEDRKPLPLTTPSPPTPISKTGKLVPIAPAPLMKLNIGQLAELARKNTPVARPLLAPAIKMSPSGHALPLPLAVALNSIHASSTPREGGELVVDEVEKNRRIKSYERRIKNREAACQSRQKKKEQMTSLEERNTTLQLRVQELEKENLDLRQQVQHWRSVAQQPGIAPAPAPAPALSDPSGPCAPSELPSCTAMSKPHKRNWTENVFESATPTGFSQNKRSKVVLMVLVVCLVFSFGAGPQWLQQPRLPTLPRHEEAPFFAHRALMAINNQDDNDGISAHPPAPSAPSSNGLVQWQVDSLQQQQQQQHYQRTPLQQQQQQHRGQLMLETDQAKSSTELDVYTSESEGSVARHIEKALLGVHNHKLWIERLHERDSETMYMFCADMRQIFSPLVPAPLKSKIALLFPSMSTAQDSASQQWFSTHGTRDGEFRDSAAGGGVPQSQLFRELHQIECQISETKNVPVLYNTTTITTATTSKDVDHIFF